MITPAAATSTTLLRTTARRWRASSRRGITDLGVRGVAPRATLYGYNLLPGFHRCKRSRRHATRPGDGCLQQQLGTGRRARTGRRSRHLGDGDRERHYGGFRWQGDLLCLGCRKRGLSWGTTPTYDGYANHYGVTAACAVNDQGQRALHIRKRVLTCGSARRRVTSPATATGSPPPTMTTSIPTALAAPARPLPSFPAWLRWCAAPIPI